MSSKATGMWAGAGVLALAGAVAFFNLVAEQKHADKLIDAELEIARTQHQAQREALGVSSFGAGVSEETKKKLAEQEKVLADLKAKTTAIEKPLNRVTDDVNHEYERRMDRKKYDK